VGRVVLGGGGLLHLSLRFDEPKPPCSGWPGGSTQRNRDGLRYGGQPWACQRLNVSQVSALQRASPELLGGMLPVVTVW